MFGDFQKAFGLNFGVDAQGGLFGETAPGTDQPPLGGPAAPSGAGTGAGQPLPGATVAKTPNPLPGAIQPGNAGKPVTAAPPATAAPSPLASPMAPGQSQPAPQPQPDAAPAAGIGSPFRNGVLQ